MTRTARTICSLALLLFAIPAAAQAQWPNYVGCGYGGYGYGGNFSSGGYVFPPPFYAVHPPVYYSPMITARPYGSSPFAWPAWYQPQPTTIVAAGERFADREAAPRAEPLTIDNPHIEGAAPAARPAATENTQSDKAMPATAGLLIINPYVAQASAE